MLLIKVLAGLFTLLALCLGVTTEERHETSQNELKEVQAPVLQDGVQDPQEKHRRPGDHEGRLPPVNDALLSPEPSVENAVR
ncbi:MAG: hypothetical protein [Microviridae sp.]|nr:MAG: hypothetical protein [Microviridae sp.]